MRGAPTEDERGAERHRQDGGGAQKALSASIIVPTYNEAENLPLLLDRLGAALDGLDHEVIVVDDDSPDRTWSVAQARGERDPHIRLIRRIGRRGLSSAVIEGMHAARGRALAVLDADLQHDERILPDLLAPILDGSADVALGSRKAPGGSYGEFGPVRRLISFGGDLLARAVLGVDVSDPMSGFFALSADRFEAIRSGLDPHGFKVLLDVLAAGDRPRVAEVGYRFRARRAGETKLSGWVIGSYLLSLAKLGARRLHRPRFLTYVGVAVASVSVRLSAVSLLGVLGFGASTGWMSAQWLAVELGLLTEFAGHHLFTFPDRRRRSSFPLGRLLRFHAIAAYALLAQFGLATALEQSLTEPVLGLRLVPVYTLVTLGIMLMLALSYRLNGTLTWPDRPMPVTVGDGQTKRPTTTSTRPVISSTARR